MSAGDSPGGGIGTSTTVAGARALICVYTNSAWGEFGPADGSGNPNWLNGGASSGNLMYTILLRWSGNTNGPVLVAFHSASAAA